jgi:glutaredoxin 2
MVSHSDTETKLLLSTSPDWYAKAVWFHKVNEDYGSFEVTPEVQKMTDEILKGVSSELEKISKLNHWVAEEIRYSGISMGEGEGYTLHKGEMTFSDRCGVCKDKAGMLVTMLRAAGFESYPAMTMAGSKIDKVPADQFNHSVTVVKLSNGNWMLLDPTWIPGVREMWSSAEQQQEFLMGIPGGSDLMTTPISNPENHYLKIKGESTLLDNGTLEGKFSVSAEGQTDANLRRTFNRNYMSIWKEVIPELMVNVSQDIEILELNYLDPYDISQPFNMSVKYRIPNYAVVTNNKIIFTPLLARNPLNDNSFASELHTDTSQTTKKYGFRQRCSKLVQIEETIKLPKFSNKSLPEFKTINSKYSAFKANYNLKANTLELKAEHSMGKRIYEAEDWQDFRTALVERFKLMNSEIILVK